MVTFINWSGVWLKTKENVQIWRTGKCICGYVDGQIDDEFVNVWLDFSIAQYMEDCSFWQTNKQKLLI